MKTAVEQLIAEIKRRVSIIQSEPQTMARELMIENLDMDLERFKEMEKEQIINAFEQGENNSVDYFNPENRIKESEQYFNETYGGSNETSNN